jgi:hypothetical protein
VLAEIVMMGRLMVMMCGSVVVSGCPMVMLMRRMLRCLCLTLLLPSRHCSCSKSKRWSRFSNDLLQRGGEIQPQGFTAKIRVRQFTPFAGGVGTPENWFVPQTTPTVPPVTGLGSGVAAE